MARSLTRRAWLGAAAASTAAAAVTRPKGVLIDSHVHLFADDQQRFPYHRNATYKPPAQPLESYARLVKEAKLDHTIIVHPEPYQDDHRYLEYCLEHEPSRGYFKGTCLFDPVAPQTPGLMESLVKRLPGRIVALRIHETRPAGKPPSTAGPIRDRDLAHPAMKQTWRAAQSLGLAIQMHMIPRYAPQVRALAAELRDLPVIIDHMGRANEGTAAEYNELLKLAELPRVYMKFSGLSYSSHQPYPYPDAKQLVRRVYDAFGPDRLIWGGLGMNMADFEKQVALFDSMFDFAPEPNRAKIRGLNAMKLFGFRT